LNYQQKKAAYNLEIGRPDTKKNDEMTHIAMVGIFIATIAFASDKNDISGLSL
jgi:hypothetical protein